MMRYVLGWWNDLYRSNAVAWVIVSLAVVYLGFAVLLGDVWLRMWLKGDAYLIYQATFLLAFVLLYSPVVSRLRSRVYGFAAWAGIGTLVGYVSGLVGYFAIALAMPNGADRILRELERSAGVESLMILVMPAILLNWLLGLLVGVLTATAATRGARGRFVV